jgi:non-heme chloroperoxidase
VALAEISVDLPGRVTLRYVEQGDPAGPVVLLLHAIADSWRVFEPLLEHLPRSIHAFALSQRGHGDAGRPETGYHPRDFSADLRAFAEALSLDPATVVGASSGGLVARRFAIDHPERTLGLVLLGTPAELKDKPLAVEWWESTVSKLADPVDPGFVRGFVEDTLGGRVSPAFLETLVGESLKLPAHVWRQTYAGLLEDDSLPELHKIEAPALIARGEDDTFLTRSEQERMAYAIPHSRLVVYREAGHMFYCEYPQRVAQDLAELVARR